MSTQVIGDENGHGGDDVRAVQALLERYQQAHRDQDWGAVRACHCDAYFRWVGTGSDDPLDWQPEIYYRRPEMERWGQVQIPEGAVYENKQEHLKTEIHENLALCVVRETGCWRRRDGRMLGSWKDEVNVWYAARIEGEWRIVAAFFRSSVRR